MKTLVDLFEVSASLTSPRPLPPPPQAIVNGATAYDTRATWVEEEVAFDWEEDTFHGGGTTEDSGMFRGNRVWSSED